MSRRVDHERLNRSQRAKVIEPVKPPAWLSQDPDNVEHRKLLFWARNELRRLGIEAYRASMQDCALYLTGTRPRAYTAAVEALAAIRRQIGKGVRRAPPV